MSLSKNLTYLKTFAPISFGFAANEIATAFPALLPNDIVKIKMGMAGHPYFKTTGHISTPVSGNAVSVYDKNNETWQVKGTVAEVDAILSQLTFYPPDYPEARNYEPTEYFENLTSGNYPLDFNIPQPPTVFCGIAVRDVNDTLLGSFDTQVDCETIDYLNQRPYFSSVNAGVAFSTGTNHYDFGEISHGLDTENVTITGEEYVYGTITDENGGTALPSSFQSVYNSSNSLFVGNKKPNTNAKGTFNFTGSLEEAKAYLDSLTATNSFQSTKDILLKITDGVIGSYAISTAWYPGTQMSISGLPTVLNTVEDTPTSLDFGSGAIWTNASSFPEVNKFTIEIQFDPAFIKDVSTATGSYDSNTGLFTVPNIGDFFTVTVILGNVTVTPYEDLNGTFQGSIQITSSNATVGSSYSSPLYVFDFNISDDIEYTNLFNSVTYTEDTKFDFGIKVPQIAHGVNSNFDIDIEASDTAAGQFWIDDAYTGSATFFRPLNHSLRIQGTRDDVNAALNYLYFAPNTDYNSNFTISYYQTRTSGDTTGFYNTPIGASTAWTVTGVGTEEYIHSSLPNVNWNEDQNTRFDIGLNIVDTSTDEAVLPLYNTDYQVTINMKYWDNGTPQSLTTAQIVCDTPNVTVSGTGTVADPLILTGKKADINAAVSNLLFVPNKDWTSSPATNGSFWASYRLVRLGDNTTFVDFSHNRFFSEGTGHTEFFNYGLPNIVWYEDILKDFNTGFEIRDEAYLNSYYDVFGTTYTVSLALYYDDNGVETPFNDATLNVEPTTLAGTSIIPTGYGQDVSPLTISGDRDEVNTCLTNIRFVAGNDITSAPDGGDFYVKAIYTRDLDGDTAQNTITFNTAIAHEEFGLPSTVYFVEDFQAQLPQIGQTFSLYHYSDGLAMQILDQVGDEATETYTVTIYTPFAGDAYLNGVLQTPVESASTPFVSPDYVETAYVLDDYKKYTYSGTRANLNSQLQTFNYANATSNGLLAVELYRDSDAKVIFNSYADLVHLTIPSVSGMTGFNFIANLHTNDPATYQYNNPDLAEIEFSSLTVTNGTDSTFSQILTKTDSVYIMDETHYSPSVNGNDLTLNYSPSSAGATLLRPYIEKVDLTVNAFFSGKGANRIACPTYTSYRNMFVLSEDLVASMPTLGTDLINATWSSFRTDDLATMRTKKISFNPSVGDNASMVEFGTQQTSTPDVREENPTSYYHIANTIFFTNTDPNDAFNKGIYAIAPFVAASINDEIAPGPNVLGDFAGSGGCLILDTLYDNNTNRAYVLTLFANTSTRLYKVDCDATGYQFVVGATLDLMASWSPTNNGAIGKLNTGEIVVTITNDTAESVEIYHQNTGGADNYGLVQSITKTVWGTGVSNTFASVFDTPPEGTSRKDIQMNTNNYLSLVGGLYYWNSSSWIELLDPASYVNGGATLYNHNALGKNFFINYEDGGMYSLQASNITFYPLPPSYYPMAHSKYDNFFLMLDHAYSTADDYRILRLTQ